MKDVNECIKFLEEECIHNKSKEAFYVSTIQYLKGFILLNNTMKENVEKLGEMINTYKNKFSEDEKPLTDSIVLEELSKETSLSKEDIIKIFNSLEKKL